MTISQSIQGDDLALAHQIATVEYTRLNQLCYFQRQQNLEILSTASRMPSIEAIRLQAEQDLEEIETALDEWFDSIRH